MQIRKCISRKFVGGVMLMLAALAPAQEITVAAAADLESAMPEIASLFQKNTGKVVKVVYGSSGNFFQQIQNGAPFELFFSADLSYATQLQAAGLVEPGTMYRYASGRIVLWVRSESKLDLNRGLAALADPGVQKIAIANPTHAPYGQAAVAALKKENLYDQVSGKLVLGENISQAASFVATGSADAGIIALAAALSPGLKGKGRYVEVRAADYPPIEQACVILKSSRQKQAAREFLEFIKTENAVQILRRYGFDVK